MPNQANEATESQSLIHKENPEKRTTAKAITDDVEAGDSKSVSTTTATKGTKTSLEDAIDIFKLSFPIFITSLSWVGVS